MNKIKIKKKKKSLLDRCPILILEIGSYDLRLQRELWRPQGSYFFC
jgi:hypothetical protein